MHVSAHESMSFIADGSIAERGALGAANDDADVLGHETRVPNHFRSCGALLIAFFGQRELCEKPLKELTEPVNVSRHKQTRVITCVEWALLLLLIGLFGVKGFVPAWRTLNTDFPNYYLAAVLYHQGIPLDRAYEWTWFQRQKDRLEIDQPLVGFVSQPPFCAAPLLPLASMPPLEAKRVWLILNLALLLGAVWLLSRATALPFRRVTLLALLCIMPLRANFLLGQYYVVILFLISAAHFVHVRGHRFLSGLLIGVAASLKIFPAGFLLLFLWKRDWRAALGVLSGIALLLLSSVALFGTGVHGVFFREVLTRAMGGETIDPYVTRSITGIWARLFLFEPTMNPAPLLSSPFLAAALKSLTTAVLVVVFLLSVRRSDEKNRNLEWSGFVILLLLLSTMPSMYHYCVLIAAAVLGFADLQRSGNSKLAMMLIAFYAFAFAPPATRWLTLLLTLLMFALLIFTAGLEQASLRSRALLISAASLFVVGSTFAGASSLKKQHAEYKDRVPRGFNAIFAGNPAAVSEGILAETMTMNSYRAVVLSGSVRVEVPVTADVLSVAGSPKSPSAFIEVAGKTPMIARIEPPAYREKLLFEGQQPSESPNGKWLAFVREEHGKGSAWLVSSESGVPVRMTSDRYDVLELAVSDSGSLIVAIGPVSSSKLAIVKQGAELAEPLQLTSGPVRHPAISPDGERLAFSRLRRGSWNLAEYEFRDHTERTLTEYPCNATEPAWVDDHTLLYASDCGRGLGLSAIGKIAVP